MLDYRTSTELKSHNLSQPQVPQTQPLELVFFEKRLSNASNLSTPDLY
jgi:hypothetical protein